ncbi:MULTISPECIES: TetR/AcrR family transcriptional regulator [Amycolatopsis]|uniref:TetR/AcrR family transcriptional regulator n=1 Tax=Amycolatopsis dendrobii TaxID=2760662 RepID=A0A7W3VVW7_9PSEU|nr:MULTISPECIES: TetR/AcrR family transcriptional regulator [Amycolatopsis]MBB1154203.1 TetR/AcrR family transcriptional regulator [Amycolatopsis dendrobii]UKD51421.1 TetR/AcrR family transcriptional regulator [Amycolatopsis sp. FU40]
MRRTQQERSDATRAALIKAARDLFGARGYHDVPAEEITRTAGVTRGALYHHFGDKQGLFRAVVEVLERELTAEVSEVLDGAADPLSGLSSALGVFLDACLRPDVRRISLTDAPAVLGWDAWRDLEAEYGLGLVAENLAAARDAGLIVDTPVDALAQLVLAAVMEAARMIANADDPDRMRGDVQQVFAGWLSGLLRAS